MLAQSFSEMRGWKDSRRSPWDLALRVAVTLWEGAHEIVVVAGPAGQSCSPGSDKRWLV